MPKTMGENKEGKNSRGRPAGGIVLEFVHVDFLCALFEKKSTSRGRPASGIVLEFVHSDFVCSLFGNVLKLRFRDHAFVVKWLFFFSGMDSSFFSSFSHCFHEFVEERLFNVFF